MIACHKSQTFFIFLPLLLSLLACSQSPVVFVKQSAGEMALIDRVKIKRQQDFMIHPLSHIGLLITPISIHSQSDSQNKQLSSIITKEGTYTFNHTFSKVTLIERLDPRQQPGIDFVIRASLMDAVSYIRDANKEEQPVSKKGEERQTEKVGSVSAFLLSRIKPYHSLIKLELIDARSKRPIDVAIIKARSGTLGSKQFMGLLRQSFSAYAKAITSTYSAVY